MTFPLWAWATFFAVWALIFAGLTHRRKGSS